MAVLPLFRDTYMAAWRQVKLKHSISFYVINSVMHAFWLVLTYDLLEDRRIVDDSTRFKFDSCVILWTNHNSLLRIATNQFASFCIDYRLSESAIFVSVKVAKFEVKARAFFSYILIPYPIKLIGSTLPCVCSVINHRGRQNVIRTLVTHLAAPFDVICDIIMNRRTATWNLFANDTRLKILI